MVFFIVAIFNDSIYHFLQDVVRRQTEILQLAIPNLESRCVRQYYHAIDIIYNYVTIKQLYTIPSSIYDYTHVYVYSCQHSISLSFLQSM